MAEIKAIETEYNGLKFRSKLEAMHAKLFDNCGIKWIYEPYIIKYSEGEYLPDFYLPEMDIYFEVKGDRVPGKEKAIKAVGEYIKDTGKDSYFDIVFGNGLNFEASTGFGLAEVLLVKCFTCNKVYFLLTDTGVDCPYCGRSGLSSDILEINIKSIRQDWGNPFKK